MPIIDRNIPSDSLREERNHSSKVFVFAIILIAALILGAISGLIGQMGDSKEPLPSETPLRIPARIAYTMHSPILIDGNAGFAGLNSSTGVTRGSGTIDDPYVIEGWEITSFPENGIEIRNADVYFVIQDCYVHQGGGWGVISLYSCSNGTISNCSCTENSFYGIYLYFSHGNSLVNNNCSDNYGGVALEYSDGNNLVNNTFWTNGHGIDITSSDNNTFINNSCSSNWSGMSLNSCVNTTLHQNGFAGDGVILWGNVLSHFNTHSIDMTNMANGQPICYFKDQTGITVPAGAGQIIMANCSDMLIENQSLSDVDVGIELAFCAGTNVTDNNCSNDTDGVQLLFSNNNSLVNNTCSSNDGNGIFLLNSRNNSLSGNNCSSGNSDGIIAYSSDGLSLSNNTCSGNEYGTRIFDSDKVSLADNNFSSNILYGIQLENCDNSTLSNNSCFWNDDYYGIQLYESVNVTLERNNLVGDGILIGGDALAHFNTHSIDTSNTANGRPIYYYKDQIGIAVPAGAGQVLMANCTDMRVENQNLSDAGAGVELVLCTGTTVTNSICSNNEYGVFVGGSPNSTLIDNTCSYCRYGIVLWRSDNNTLVGNNCSSNSEDGVWLAVAQDNSLISNNCSSNGGAGVNLYYSSRNSLIGNNCSSCYYGINIYDTCDDNILHLNWIGYNVGYGIYLGWGYHTRIWNNTFTDNNGAGSTYDPNHVQACDSSGCNWWNSTDGCGNYWSDWTAPDNDSDGIVDYPYVLDGTAGARDYSPLTTVTTEPIPEFGMMPFVVMVFLAAVLLTREARRRKAQ